MKFLRILKAWTGGIDNTKAENIDNDIPPGIQIGFICSERAFLMLLRASIVVIMTLLHLYFNSSSVLSEKDMIPLEHEPRNKNELLE